MFTVVWALVFAFPDGRTFDVMATFPDRAQCMEAKERQDKAGHRGKIVCVKTVQ